MQICEEDVSSDFRTKIRRRLHQSEANLVLRTLLKNMILDVETLQLVGFDDFVGEEVRKIDCVRAWCVRSEDWPAFALVGYP